MLCQSVCNSFHNGNGASGELCTPLTNVLPRRPSPGPFRRCVAPEFSVGLCRRRAAARSGLSVLIKSDAESQQHYRSLSAFVRPPAHKTTRHGGDGEASGRGGFQVASDVRSVDAFTAVCIAADFIWNRRVVFPSRHVSTNNLHK